MSASGAGWKGRPTDLEKRLTPLKVRIANNSGRPVRILYQDFELVGSKGRVYQPIPVIPLDHAEDGRAKVVRPMYGASEFFVGRRYQDVYPSFPAWERALPRDQEFYSRQYGLWSDGLPSDEMQRMALPEGVLADGGRVAGFLYFEDATRRDKQLKLRASLESESQPEGATEIEIPFRVE